VSGETKAVFLSYASEDSEASARIAEALKAAGIEVWFDKSELRGGDAWDRKIRDQIRHCSLFIPIISVNSQARLEGYFRREWKVAVERKQDIADEKPFLVPVVVDETPERGAAVPEGFHDVQWTRLPGGASSSEFVQHISRLLTGSQATRAAHSGFVAPLAAGKSAPNRRPVANRSSWVLLAAVASIAVLAYVVIDRFLLRKSESLVPGPAAPRAVADRSIAVLPFADLSEKHDQEYFSDGIAEETLNQLAKIPGLKVIGRTSSFQFKGKSEDLRQIGSSLGAAYVLEGSVRRAGDRVRVTAQLIEASSGTHRWSQSFDRGAADILAVQDEIAAGLARALQLEVIPPQRGLPLNPEAHDSYLRGLHAFQRYDEEGFREAAAEFQRALAIEPNFVAAAESLARALLDEATWGFVPPTVGFERARNAANAALKLGAPAPMAHSILSSVHVWHDWDWKAAEQELKIAMTLASNDPLVSLFASEYYLAIGDWEAATRLHTQTLSLDPLLPSLYEESAWTLMRMGRLPEAESTLRRLLEISPTYVEAHHELGSVLLLEGKADSALTQMQQENPLGGRSAGLVVAYHALGRNKEAEAELKRLESEHAQDMAFWIAEVHAFCGRKDAAFDWLERALEQRDVFLWLIKGDPLLRSLESDPRYKPFLRKMNL
jgi:adenylate cyclase